MIEIDKFFFFLELKPWSKCQQLKEIWVIISCSLKKLYQDIAAFMFKFQYLAIAFAMCNIFFNYLYLLSLFKHGNKLI